MFLIFVRETHMWHWYSNKILSFVSSQKKIFIPVSRSKLLINKRMLLCVRHLMPLSSLLLLLVIFRKNVSLCGLELTLQSVLYLPLMTNICNSLYYYILVDSMLSPRWRREIRAHFRCSNSNNNYRQQKITHIQKMFISSYVYS